MNKKWIINSDEERREYFGRKNCKDVNKVKILRMNFFLVEQLESNTKKI